MTHRHKPRPIPQARRGGTQLRSGCRGGRLCKAERSFRFGRKPSPSNDPLLHRGSYGRGFRPGCIAPPFILAPLPRPPPLRASPPPPRLPRHHPDVLPGYGNDAAESGLAAINKECGTATHTTATPLPALTVYAVPPVLRSTLIFMPIHNTASSSGHHRPSADVTPFHLALSIGIASL